MSIYYLLSTFPGARNSSEHNRASALLELTVMISCMEIRTSPSVKGAVGATVTSGPSTPVRGSSKYKGCEQELACHTSPFPGKQRDQCGGNGGREGRVVGDELREVTGDECGWRHNGSPKMSVH